MPARADGPPATPRILIHTTLHLPPGGEVDGLFIVREPTAITVVVQAYRQPDVQHPIRYLIERVDTSEMLDEQYLLNEDHVRTFSLDPGAYRYSVLNTIPRPSAYRQGASVLITATPSE